MPATSPDCNPIENCFVLLKSQLQPTARVEELKTEMREAWRRLTNTYLKAFAQSMPKRLRLVIKYNGAIVDYLLM